MHAQYPKMPQIKCEADTFELTSKSNPDVDSFVLAGGDNFIGATKEKNKLVSPFLNETKVEYSALGNHDVDRVATFQDNLENTDTKFLAANMKRTGVTPFDKYLDDKRIVSSTIVEKNGHKYGIVGAAPFKLSSSKQLKKANLSVEKYEKTRDNVQAEVKKLQEQGIDKIIMVSHLGYANDFKLAQEVSGIDVIVGGHSHDLVEGLTPGKNIVTAPDGNPVIITQAGQNGEFTGKLDVTFDKSGKIIAATNKVKSTKDAPKSVVIKFFEDRILGKATPMGTLTRVDEMNGNSKVVENPYANFFADAMKNELGADVALVNSANIRGKLATGPLTDLDIKNLIPFENTLVKVELSEKQVVDSLKDGAKSVHDGMLKPGIMQVAGLRYKIDKQGNLSEVKIQNKDGSFASIDTKNPSEDKKYTAIIDEFLLSSDEYPTLNQAKVIEKYDFDKTKVAQDYIQKLDQNNLQVKLDGRIENESVTQ